MNVYLQQLLFCLLALSSAFAEKMNIGGIYGITGSAASLGVQVQQGALLYRKHHPDSSLTIVIEDHKWETATAVSAFHSLNARNKLLVAHVLGSPASLALLPITKSQSALLFALGAHPELMNAKPYVIRHGNLATDDITLLTNSLIQKNPASLAVISIENEWGETWQKGLEHALKTSLPSAAITAIRHAPSESDLRPIVTKALATKPDLIIIASQGANCDILHRQLRELGFLGDIYFNTGLGYSNEAKKAIQTRKDPKVWYQHYPKPTAEFLEAFKEEFGTEASYPSLVSYLDFEILEATAKSNPRTAADIFQAITALQKFQGRYATVEISSDGDILVPTELSKVNDF